MDLSTLKEDLTSIFSKGGDNDRLLFEYLVVVTRPFELRTWVTELLESDSHLDSLCETSYSHPNGYSKYLIYKNRSHDFQLRLHVWHEAKDQQTRKTDVHNHTRSFWSRLVYGDLLAKDYELSPNGAQFHRYSESHFRVRNSDDGAVTYNFDRESGERRLQCTREYRLTNGHEFHSLPFDKFHQIVNSNSHGAATLFVQGPKRQEKTLVFKEEDKQRQFEVHLNRTSKDTIRSQFRTMIGRSCENAHHGS